MAESSLSDTDISRLRMAVLASTAFVVFAFFVSYILWGHDGLPIGSDTPGYVAQSNLVASQGPLALLALQGPYDFLYQLFAGFIVWTGIPAMDMEIVLPVILAASLPFLTSRLALIHLGLRTATVVALAVPAWYAVYRIPADLHANLLALILVLASIIFLSKASSIRQTRCIAGLTLLGLASLTHIETTLLFTSVLLVASLSTLRPYPSRVGYAIVAIVLPASILYGVHLQQILFLTGGTLDFSSGPMTASSWILYLGPLLPLTILGIVALSARRTNWLEVVVLVWGTAALLVGMSQYASPQLINFAKRSVILVPTPLLVAVGWSRLLRVAGNVRTRLALVQNFQRGLLVAIVIVIVSSWPLVYGTATQSHNLFITTSQYQHLLWASSNLKSSTVPIFMFNDLDEYAGGLSQLYDNWASAIVGNHLSYLGFTNYLIQLEETPFADPIARAMSTTFMQQIRDSGINNTVSLLQHPIVIFSDFYRPFPLPRYTSNLFTEVSPGVFVDNPTMLGDLSNVTIPLFIGDIGHTGPWRPVPEPWAESLNAFEVYVDKAPIHVQTSYYLNVASAGTYAVSIRYWDQTGNNLTVTLDARILGIIYYNNSKTPIIRDFNGIDLTPGTHTVTIKIDQIPYPLRWASLDYLVLSRS